MLSRIETIPIRQAFADEARNFTPWLEQHIEALSERIGLTLEVEGREVRVGDFLVDLLCRDAEGRRVIIENQLDRTDHGHLGQVITYLVGLEASTAIWISPDPRAEHQRAIEWLNEFTPANLSFYLVKVEAIRIADSPIAPLFQIVAGPDAQAKATGGSKKTMAASEEANLEFWRRLFDAPRAPFNPYNGRTPGPSSWVGTGIGKAGVSVVLFVARKAHRAELYIDSDKGNGKANKAIFDRLWAEREAIEQEIGEPLEWLRLDEKRASIVRKSILGKGISDRDAWDEIVTNLLALQERFDKVFRPRISRIQV